MFGALIKLQKSSRSSGLVINVGRQKGLSGADGANQWEWA